MTSWLENSLVHSRLGRSPPTPAPPSPSDFLAPITLGACNGPFGNRRPCNRYGPLNRHDRSPAQACAVSFRKDSRRRHSFFSSFSFISSMISSRRIAAVSNRISAAATFIASSFSAITSSRSTLDATSSILSTSRAFGSSRL